MSSGKQLSFAYGEVSPSLRFTTDAEFYSKALAKLKNGYVRKSGGVSNRPGTLHYLTSDHQANIPSMQNNKTGVRLFSFVNAKDDRYIIELQAVVNGAPPSWDWVANPVYNAYNPVRFITSYGDIYDMLGVAFPFTQTDPATITLNLKGAVFTKLNNSATITFNDGRILVISHNDNVFPGSSFSVSSDYSVPVRVGTPAAIGATITHKGSAPTDIPVCYLVTQELDDGSEVTWQSGCYGGSHPHSVLSSELTIDTSNLVGVKQYNIYRSAGGPSGYNGASLSLVGRLAPSASVTTFRDFLAVSDITVQPPIQADLYPAKNYIRRLFYYKERAIAVVKQYQTKFVEGMLVASKLGAPKMFGRPLTPNVLDAFSFTIPQDKLSRITNVLVLNKLIVFTKEVAVYIRGGEGGVLTAQTVNPEVIYQEGCTPDVEPVAVGSKGFYITYDLSKLVVIIFERDDAVSVADASTLSDHFFEDKDIRSMALVKGPESILWILKTNGTLISITIGAEGLVLGYAQHSTDGYIEDICVHEALTNTLLKKNDTIGADISAFSSTIYMSVIRSGVRHYENLSIRGDSNLSTFMFMDCASSFGRYMAAPEVTGSAWNITTATTFAAGETLNLEDANGYGFVDASYLDNVIEFYYYQPEFDLNNKFIKNIKRSVRLFPIAVVNGNNMTVYCEQDLPAQLQDIWSKGYSYEEELSFQGWFVNLTNIVYGLNHLVGKEVAVYADGQVISSPNKNDGNDVLVVQLGGVLVLPEHYSYGYVGLPYTFEMETLDLEASDARTFTDKGKLINSSGVAVNKTLGGEIGANENNEVKVFEPLTQRENYGNIDATELVSGARNIPFPGSWNTKGNVTIRQVDPLPITVLAVYPKGVIGD